MAITKKVRFEVFKRDSFRCGYCGKTPPEVTLEIDHIKPKSRKGKDDINNLLTACFDCNRGKKNIPLKTIPTALKDNLEILKEKETQVEEYNKSIAKIERRIQRQMVKVDNVFNSYFPNLLLSDSFKSGTLKRFIGLLQINEILDAMHIACGKMHQKSWNADDKAIRYFCGICWNKINAREPNG